jgi:hypothetical protein
MQYSVSKAPMIDALAAWVVDVRVNQESGHPISKAKVSSRDGGGP